MKPDSTNISPTTSIDLNQSNENKKRSHLIDSLSLFFSFFFFPYQSGHAIHFFSFSTN